MDNLYWLKLYKIKKVKQNEKRVNFVKKKKKVTKNNITTHCTKQQICNVHGHIKSNITYAER